MHIGRVTKSLAVLVLIGAGAACGGGSNAGLSAGPPTIAVKARPATTPATFTPTAAPTSPQSSATATATTTATATATASPQTQTTVGAGAAAAAPTATAVPTAPPTTAPTTPPAPAPVTLAVSTMDNFFSPKNLTVRVGQQVTVLVTNDGKAFHNWAVVNPSDPSGTHPESPLLKPGEKGQVVFTFAQAGTYAFHCDVHPQEMTGTLVVQ